jgi:hypothetical protein
MATIRVQPRDTPADLPLESIDVEVDEALTVHAAQLEEWVARTAHWELQYREGHEFGKVNNVEARMLFAGPGHTCSLTFRLDEIDSFQEFDGEVWLLLDVNEGIANGIHLAPTGLDVDFFHIVGPPLGGTAA